MRVRPCPTARGEGAPIAEVVIKSLVGSARECSRRFASSVYALDLASGVCCSLQQAFALFVHKNGLRKCLCHFVFGLPASRKSCYTISTQRQPNKIPLLVAVIRLARLYKIKTPKFSPRRSIAWKTSRFTFGPSLWPPPAFAHTRLSGAREHLVPPGALLSACSSPC